MVYMHQSLGRSCSGACGPSRSLGAKEDLASSDCSVLTPVCLALSAWTGLPWVRAFGVFLAAKEDGSGG
jgi:hypothetical protein